jgi:hypothetical protein
MYAMLASGNIAARKPGGIEQRRIEAAVIGVIQLVDDLAFDVRVKYLDIDAELGRIAANVLVIFRQRHLAEYFGLHLATHVHTRAMDDQDLRHADVLVSG